MNLNSLTLCSSFDIHSKFQLADLIVTRAAREYYSHSVTQLWTILERTFLTLNCYCFYKCILSYFYVTDEIKEIYSKNYKENTYVVTDLCFDRTLLEKIPTY